MSKKQSAQSVFLGLILALTLALSAAGCGIMKRPLSGGSSLAILGNQASSFVGTWTSNCLNDTLRIRLSFSEKGQFAREDLQYSDFNCGGEPSTIYSLSGEFEIGQQSASVPNARALLLFAFESSVESNANRIYPQIFQLSGNQLILGAGWIPDGELPTQLDSSIVYTRQ